MSAQKALPIVGVALTRIDQLAAGDAPVKADLALFFQLGEEFRCRCRRLDARRKRAHHTMVDLLRRHQRAARSAVGAAIRSIQLSARIDATKLSQGDRRTLRENVIRSSAMLIGSRDVLLAGGITKEHLVKDLERAQAAPN